MAYVKSLRQRKLHSKLFLGDLSLDEEIEKFYVGDDAVTHVDVLGTVVSLFTRGDADLFDIDDGTGIVRCVHFSKVEARHQEDQALFERSPEIRKQHDEELPAEERIKRILFLESAENLQDKPTKLEHQLLKILVSKKFQPKLLQLGDLVNIRGRLSVYRSKPQIVVNHLRYVRNPNEEGHRVLEIEAFNRTFRPNLDKYRSDLSCSIRNF